MAEKRRLAEGAGGSVSGLHADDAGGGSSKRLRVSEALVALPPAASAAASSPPARSSFLPAPTMELKAHQAGVNCCKFSAGGGDLLVTAGDDRLLLLWSFLPSATAALCRNVAVLKGHKAAVLDVCWAGPSRLLSASADGSAAVWDVETARRLKVLRHHSDHVNAVAAAAGGLGSEDDGDGSARLFVTAGDDCLLLLYDSRALRRPVQSLPQATQPLSCALSASCLFHAGIDSALHCHDLRRLSASLPLFSIAHHTDSVTGIALHPSAALLLSHSADSTLALHDVAPFSQHPSRTLQSYRGAHHDHDRNLLRCGFSGDGELVTGGSAGRAVLLWDAATGEERWRLPGHRGCVNEVALHPTALIVASAASDKRVLVGELMAQ